MGETSFQLIFGDPLDGGGYLAASSKAHVLTFCERVYETYIVGYRSIYTFFKIT